MKCLSVCQPFAELIISNKKTIELRSWNTKFRGEFFVHSPIKVLVDECERLGMGTDLITGAIVGTAEIFDVKRYSSDEELMADARQHMAGAPESYRYGFCLRGAKRLDVPIPSRGMIGFYDVNLPGRNDIIADIIDEEQRYGLIGHH